MAQGLLVTVKVNLRRAMTEAIMYALILACVVGGPWLTLTVLIKPKRRKGHGTKLSFDNYFATAAPRHPAPRRPQTPTAKPAQVAEENRGQASVHVGSSALLPLSPAADAVVAESESRLLLSPPRYEPKI